MERLPHTLYRSAAVRELDRITIEEGGIPGARLMARAGAAAFAALQAHWPGVRRVLVLCGVGNNAGDGYVVARLAHNAGYQVQVWRIGEHQRLRGDALDAAQQALDAGVEVHTWSRDSHLEGEVVVDALLGTGLDGEVRGPFADAIAAINRCGLPVLSLDIPSGLHADHGVALGCVVQAQVTITFIGLKQGLFTGEGRQSGGVLLFDDLGVPEWVFERVAPAALRSDYAQCRPWFSPRPRNAHKGDFGHVLVVGGELGMSGAARMAGEAALRCGAGLVSIATRPEHAPLLNLTRPELMCHGVAEPVALAPLLQRADVVVIGPGLGTGPWGRGMLARVLECHHSLVVDADALNLLAGEPLRRGDWVLTPHPGEAARLLGCAVARVQADRFTAAAALEAGFDGVVVLKGAGTVICDAQSPLRVCSDGNPGMAGGGMGDVLSGVIGSLIAQGMDLSQAAEAGVCVHAAAADHAAHDGERGLLAADLFVQLRALVNPR